MKSLDSMRRRLGAGVLAAGLALAPFGASLALAQNSSNSSTTTQSSQPSSTGGSSQTTKSTTTTTTTTAQPVQTTVREASRTTGIDPLWLIIGGIALLAIVLIALFSMRGRSRADRVAVVQERETVIKRD